MVIDSVIYSVPYLFFLVVLLAIALMEGYYAEKNKLSGLNYQIIALFSILLFILFFGLRGFIGWDWTIYYQKFESVSVLQNLSMNDFIKDRYEPGFIILMSVSKSIVNNYIFFLFISTLIDLILLSIFLRKYAGRFALGLVVFIAFMGFYMMTDLLRNSKAILIFLLTIRYIEGRKAIPFIAWNLIGLSFHFSVLFLLPVYFFIHKKASLKVVLTISLIGLSLFLFRIEFVKPVIRYIAELIGGRLQESTMNYLMLDQYSSSYGITIGFFERLLTASLVFIYYDDLTASRRNIIFTNAFLIFFLIFLFFSEIKIVPIRVGGLFAFSYWYLYPSLLGKIKIRGNRQLFFAYILIYSVVKLTSMTDTILYRYDNVLFGIQSFNDRMTVFDKVKDTLIR